MRYLIHRFLLVRRSVPLFCWWLGGLFFPVAAGAQTGDTGLGFVRIDTIMLEGNRKTKPSLILRELEFSAGDSLPLSTLAETLERNRLRVMNLSLFSSSTVELDTLGGGRLLAVRFRLVEMWYLYPIPLFELADRNFNVWWSEFNRSLKRVNYGIAWTHLNLSGHADILRVNLNFGYSNRYELVYERPWLNRRQTLGFRVATGFSRTHEVAYRTGGNKQLFTVDPDNWQKNRYYANLSLRWRPKLLVDHSAILEYHFNQIADTITTIVNPDFFLDSRSRQRHFSLIYRFTIDKRDIRPYPLSGWLAVLDLRQNGLLPSDDLHLFRATAEWKKYTAFTPFLSLETVLKARVSLPRRQPPFFNNQALGYGNDLVRGYEFFVMDGLDYGLLRSSVHLRLFEHTFNFGKIVPMKAFKVMPLKLYFSINNDLGYANDPYYAANNPLTNRLLYGYGIGLDIIAFYDKVAKFEWSWKGTGGGGFFLNINTGI
ncbi:MAG: BamA/TamA family outer membrane protein [Saprospiraceae bacterium]|nr:BamA/TamA family outer membrane protein [Saprospiraceae bacterium]